MKVFPCFLLSLFILIQFDFGFLAVCGSETNISQRRLVSPRDKSSSASIAADKGQNFQLNGPSAKVICGQTIKENTILYEDIICPPESLYGIVIGAPNITLDLGGHALKGYTSSVGVLAYENDGIIIRNGTIEGFNDGVFIINSRHVTVENLTVKNQDSDPNHFIFGIHVASSHNAVVRDILFEFPSVPHKSGVEIFGSDVAVSNIEVRGGGAGVGFSFAEVCDPLQSPSNGEVINSKFSQTYVAGIYVACSSNVRISGNDFSSAPGVGVGIQGEAPFYGAVTGLKVEGNYIHNDVIGIEFRGVAESVISNNIISSSSAWGIALRQSLGCLIGEPGWACVYSTSNMIADNQSLGNGTDLYHYEDSIGNVWERNACETKQGIDIPECTPMPTFPLIVLKSGTGGGTIVSGSSAEDIDCGSACYSFFPLGDPVTLTATADNGSTFTNWSGCDSISDTQCVVTMTAGKSINATFIAVPPLKMTGPSTSYFQTLLAAYAAAADGASIEIEALAVELTETADLNRDIFVSLKGGYDDSFTGDGGYTTIVGTIAVTRGSLEVDSFIVK